MRISDEVPEAEAEIDLVSNEVHRLDRVVRTFLDLNRPMELEIQEFDPAELAGAASSKMMRPGSHAGQCGTAAGAARQPVHGAGGSRPHRTGASQHRQQRDPGAGSEAARMAGDRTISYRRRAAIVKSR